MAVNIRIDYEDDSSVLLEALGPNTIIGMTQDYAQGFYTGSPNGKRVKAMIIGREVTMSTTLGTPPGEVRES